MGVRRVLGGLWQNLLWEQNRAPEARGPSLGLRWYIQTWVKLGAQHRDVVMPKGAMVKTPELRIRCYAKRSHFSALAAQFGTLAICSGLLTDLEAI